MSILTNLFLQADQQLPIALDDWEDRVSSWCKDYSLECPKASLSEINLNNAVFLFDHQFERVTLAYALSVPALMKRDASRIRRFPDVNVSIKKVLGKNAFVADRGHFLGHANGGELDINLFPQRRELNQGRSEEGKLFRKMERWVAKQQGTFFYHRPIYNDETWIPAFLEYGVLIDGSKWWIERFQNK